LDLIKPSIPEEFTHLLKRADSLANAGNVEGLKDLIKLVMRPLQAKHMLRPYISDDHKCGTDLNWQNELGISSHITAKVSEHLVDGRDFTMWCWSDDCFIKDKDLYPQLDLSTDIVLTTPWHPDRILRNIGVIGENRRLGPFKQDFSNHVIAYQYPLMIGWVNGGNHSIMQGIISGAGTLIPDEVHDISLLIDAVGFNGLHWYSRISGNHVGAPRNQEFGWCWEIARRIMLLQPSPFKGISK
jgi:hypothetical protein